MSDAQKQRSAGLPGTWHPAAFTNPVVVMWVLGPGILALLRWKNWV